MAQKPIENVILDEVLGAHGTSLKILELIEEESEEDPIAAILAALETIQRNQLIIMTRLGNIERRLASHD